MRESFVAYVIVTDKATEVLERGVKNSQQSKPAGIFVKNRKTPVDGMPSTQQANTLPRHRQRKVQREHSKSSSKLKWNNVKTEVSRKSLYDQ